jgi:16S rRNA G527 N7-methylase RsmG
VRVLDVGAGGGLPGFRSRQPCLGITSLLDKVGKKVAFLMQAKLELASRTSMLCTRVEDYDAPPLTSRRPCVFVARRLFD